jgi:hypothetical protein
LHILSLILGVPALPLETLDLRCTGRPGAVSSMQLTDHPGVYVWVYEIMRGVVGLWHNLAVKCDIKRLLGNFLNAVNKGVHVIAILLLFASPPKFLTRDSSLFFSMGNDRIKNI